MQDDQRAFDAKMVLELKKLKWVIENEGYIPSINEAIIRIVGKYEDEEEESMESLMDDASDDEEDPHEFWDDNGGTN
jgi:predicted RND superfamily exporter protein